MTLDDLRFTSVLPSPKWQREAALRLLKLVGFYSLLSLGGALLLLLARDAIAWATGATGATFMFRLIGGGTGAYLLYRWLILARTPRDWHQLRGIELIRGIPGGEGSDRNLPYFGRIAAGRPIESVSGHERVAVPRHLLSDSGGDHYVLSVVGESMIAEGIHDGDFVIVLRRDSAEPGDMAVVLIGDEATLKRFYSEGDLVRLQPANPIMRPIRLPARDVRVQGVVVGLIRKY